MFQKMLRKSVPWPFFPPSPAYLRNHPFYGLPRRQNVWGVFAGGLGEVANSTHLPLKGTGIPLRQLCGKESQKWVNIYLRTHFLSRQVFYGMILKS